MQPAATLAFLAIGLLGLPFLAPEP